MEMKRFLLGGLLLCGLSTVGSAEINRAGALGVGLGLGQPMGVTGKFWLSPNSAVDAMMGYHFGDNFDLHGDFLYHVYPFAPQQSGLPIYIGAGARILAGDDTQFGIRLPFGISYFLPEHRMELFAEIAPVIVLTDIDAAVDGMIGVRIYAF